MGNPISGATNPLSVTLSMADSIREKESSA